MEEIKPKVLSILAVLYRAWLLFLAALFIAIVVLITLILNFIEGPPTTWKNDTLYPSGWERKWLNSRL